MEAAKAAVSKFTSSRGHKTTVEETVNPAITHEAVKPVRHEEQTQAVDREVHQHHHHTTVQPLTHQERLAEQHTHNVLPTEHREFHHEDESATKERLQADLGRFKDSSVTHQTQHTQAAAPTVTGEHVHHHVHETVIPVVHKETIQPEVVHTTRPVHETHHAAAQHHGMSALPMKSLDEFKKAGGALTGGSHSSHEQYEGAPRPYNENLSTTFEKLESKFPHHHAEQGQHGTTGVGGTTGGLTGTTGTHDNLGSTRTTGTHNTLGNTGTTSTTGAHNTLGNTGTTGITGQHGTGLTDSNKSHRPHDSGIGGVGNDNYGNSGSLGQRGAGQMGTLDSGSSTTSAKKPSLLDRLNPMKDTDRDGKAGLMD